MDHSNYSCNITNLAAHSSDRAEAIEINSAVLDLFYTQVNFIIN